MMNDSGEIRVLFVTHDASRTGAPIALLRLLRWLREHTALRIDVLLRRSGPLAPDFAAVADAVFDWQAPASKPSLGARAWTRLRHMMGLPVSDARDRLVASLGARGYVLVFGNTVVVCDVLARLMQTASLPAVLRVPDLEGSIRYGASSVALEWVLARASCVISVSALVTRNLVGRHGVPAERVVQIPGSVPAFTPSMQTRARSRIRLDLSDSALLVGGSGSFAFRKGPELFVQVAQRVTRLLPEGAVQFVWVGGDSASTRYLLEEDARRLGLADRVVFTGEVPDAIDWFQAFDLFLTTAREDPFPLVCLENAQCGNPIVCFADAIGSTEFIDESCGHVSPYLDLDDMAHAVAEFAADPDRRRRAGEEIRRRAAAYTTERVAPRIAACIREVIDARKASQ